MRGTWTAWLAVWALTACGGESPGELDGDPTDSATAGTSAASEEVDEGAEVVPLAERVLFLVPEEIDVGEMEPMSSSELEFSLENRGDTKVFLRGIKTSCKCVRLEADAEELEPGESVRITGTVKATRSGTARIRVFVRTTHRTQPMATGAVKFHLTPMLVAAPRRIDWSDSKLDEIVEREIVVSCIVPAGKELTAPEPVLGGSAPLTLTALESSHEETGPDTWRVKYPYRLTLDTSAPQPRAASTLSFTSEGFLPLAIQIESRVYSGWYLDYQKLHMRVVRVGEVQEKVFKIQFDTELMDEQPTADVTTDVEDLTVTSRYVLDVDKPYLELTARYAPTKKHGHVEGLITVRASFAPDEPIEVPFSVRVRKSPGGA